MRASFEPYDEQARRLLADERKKKGAANRIFPC